MPVEPYTFDTGNSILPDVGTLNINGVEFSSLYKSRISGVIVQDDAKRTTKLMEYTLSVEGLTSPNADNISGEPFNTEGGGIETSDEIWNNLRAKLTQTGGTVVYQSKGFGNFSINESGAFLIVDGRLFDVAWGPVPRLLEFSPLGGGNAAFVRLQVVVRVYDPANKVTNPFAALQFNWEYHLGYDDRGYAKWRIQGTLEIPLTRTSAQSRTIAYTVDDWRQKWLNLQADLGKFRISERSFDFSRDKRTVNFSFQAEELPPMGLPPGCTVARGTFSVRNVANLKGGGGKGKLSFEFWQCSLRCTYTVRGDQDQRVAYLAFCSILWYRVNQARQGIVPTLADRQGVTQQQAPQAPAGNMLVAMPVQGDNAVTIWNSLLKQQTSVRPGSNNTSGVLVTDFGFDEGLYLDSDTVTFHAAWVLPTSWRTLLAACGFQRWQVGTSGRGGQNLWSQSVQAVMGAQSWLNCSLNAFGDIIVDMGGGGPWGLPEPP